MVSTSMTYSEANKENNIQDDQISIFSNSEEIEQILFELEIIDIEEICLGPEDVEEILAHLDLECHEQIEDFDEPI